MLNVLFLVVSSVYSQSDVSGGRIDGATYQRVVEENLELRKGQARLEVEAGELRRRNAALLLDVQDLERKRDQFTVLISQLRTPDETKSEIARLQSEKVVLVREIERLREALTAASAPSATNLTPRAVEPAPGSDLFRKIEKENADLRLEVAKARESAMNESVNRVVASKGEAQLKEEVAKLFSQLKQTQADLAVLQKREAAWKRALETQARKVVEAEKNVKGLKSEITDLKSKVQSQQPEVSPLSNPTTQQRNNSPVATLSNPTTQQRNNSPVSALLAAAQKHLAANQVKEAEKLYLQAFKQESDNPQVSYNLGVLYGDYLRNERKAIKYYRRYLNLAPKAPDAATVRIWINDLETRAKW